MTHHPHRRYNPLTGEWTLVSPHRADRPWQGKVETRPKDDRPQYDPDCYLCPGNERAGGNVNPNYQTTHVFTNDFPALLPEGGPDTETGHPLLQHRPLRGTCRVICFSPRHDLTLPEMEPEAIVRVVDTWCEQMEELGKKYRWVQVFENKGKMMGCSNPHPHGQIWAGDQLPNEIIKEEKNQWAYFEEHGTPLLREYLAHETQEETRIVVENEDWVALVPYWAVWPFETLLLPRNHALRLTDLSGRERRRLAEILKALLTKYDNIFETSFPYSMGWHGAPNDEGDYDHWQLHAHFYPPLLRSATVKKFMVGYEMLAEPQRDITAEQAAQRIREASNTHYTQRS